MPFPEYERVLYNKNPLVEVVCQLRFPPILKINIEEPYKFQDVIREKYPNYEMNIEYQQQVSFGMNQGQPMVPQIVQGDSIRNYKFSSVDDIWHINLTSTFIAISTSGYSKWEDFKERFELPLEALIKEYKPAYFDRIGLRYVDVFNRTKLGLVGAKWVDLIQPNALGFLSSEEPISSRVRLNTITSEILLDDDKSIAKIVTAIGKVNSDPEECFIIDDDLYTLGKNELDVWPKLEYLHTHSGRFIRWIIKDSLHYAMEPEKI